MSIKTRLVLWRKIAKLLKHYWFIVQLSELNTCLISCRCLNLVYHALNLTFMKMFERPVLCEHSWMLVFYRLVSCICSRYNALYRCFTDSLLVISGRFNFPQIYRYGIIDATKHQHQVADKYKHLEEFILQEMERLLPELLDRTEKPEFILHRLGCLCFSLSQWKYVV